MRYALMLSFAALVACNGSEPPPPPPPPTCELDPADCPSGEVDEATCSCVPLPPPPPPPADPSCQTPPADRVDSDYIPLDRADHWQREMKVYDQRLINNGVRNPFFALQRCKPGTPESVWPYHGISAEQAGDVIDRATELKRALTGDDGESGFYERVAEQHPRRPEGRSRVYRPCFTEYWEATLEITDGCSERDEEGNCTRFNPSSSPTGPVARLDGVKGACLEKLE